MAMHKGRPSVEGIILRCKNDMLVIDILRNYFPKDLGVLMGDFWGFGCPKDAQTPCSLRLYSAIRASLGGKRQRALNGNTLDNWDIRATLSGERQRALNGNILDNSDIRATLSGERQ